MMQIQIKQTEVEQAIKDYLTKQGISLVDMDVAITFTSGRKGAGLTASVSIEQGVAKDPIQYAAPALVALITEEPEEVPTVQEEEEATPVTKTSSLFG